MSNQAGHGLTRCNYCAELVAIPCQSLDRSTGCFKIREKQAQFAAQAAQAKPPAYAPNTAAVPDTPRAAILTEAMEITHKDRNANYGNPEDNFKQIAELWSAYKKQEFTSHDVAIMSMLIKVARLSKNPQHHDSVVDIAGYAACLGDIQAKQPTVPVALGVLPKMEVNTPQEPYHHNCCGVPGGRRDYDKQAEQAKNNYSYVIGAGLPQSQL